MFFQVFTLFVVFEAALSASTGSTETLSNGEFTTDLLKNIIKNDDSKSSDNLIYSPASIQTCLALAYFGAEGKTASELVSGLHFTTPNKEAVAKQFENALEVARGPKPLIKLANKIYTDKELEIKPEFNEIAKKSFASEAESLDFKKTTEAVHTINSWVAANTNDKIKDFLTENSIGDDTKMVLVNAIHFKGAWKSPLNTRDGEFFNLGTKPAKADFMFTEDDFMYGEFEDLKARAIQMPYADSDLSLMLILPEDKTGFHEVEEKLKNANLLDLAAKMSTKDVAVTIPKFKVESKFDMNAILKSMGMETMFTDDAKFNFFTTDGASKVGKVFHQAFIDVNELGTEAAASTGLTIVPTSLNLNQKFFYADHPFFFAILDKSNVYFAGHLNKM